MLPDVPTPTPREPDDDNDAAKLMHDELDPMPLSPARRAALLRRILARTRSAPPLAPEPPHAD
jgi:hypothetical protein